MICSVFDALFDAGDIVWWMLSQAPPFDAGKVVTDIEELRKAISFIGSYLTIISAAASFIGLAAGILTVILAGRAIHDLFVSQKSEQMNQMVTTSIQMANHVTSILKTMDDAAQRAIGAQKQFINFQVQQIASLCVRVIEDTSSDDKSIMAVSKNRALIREYSQTIRALLPQIEFNSKTTEDLKKPIDGSDPELPMPAACYFILGFDHHMQQNFGPAIDHWKMSRDAARQKNVSYGSHIEQRVPYWIAYEFNNTGKFQKAIEEIGRRIRDIKQGRYGAANEDDQPELERLEVESKFFRRELNVNCDDLISLLDASMRDHAMSRKQQRAHQMMKGNIFMISDVFIQDSLDRAKAAFEVALEDAPQNVWAKFGYAQCLDIEGSAILTTDIRDILDAMTAEFNSRQEPRARVLRKTTEYICLKWLRAHESRLDLVASAIQTALSDVDEEVMIYSQLQKKNLTKKKFAAEMKLLYEGRSMKETIRAIPDLVEFRN